MTMNNDQLNVPANENVENESSLECFSSDKSCVRSERPVRETRNKLPSKFNDYDMY